MLTNLDFLLRGSPWPPPSETERLRLYEKNRALFEGDKGSVDNPNVKRIQEVIGEWDDVISYEIALNYYQLVTKKTADLMLSEWPTIQSEDKATQAVIDTLMKDGALIAQCYETVLDISRYGDGTMGVARWEDGVQIYAGRTDCWFPVVDPVNIKRRLHNVVAVVVTPDATKPNQKELHIEIHSPAQNEKRVHALEGSMIGKELAKPQVTPTGLGTIDYWQTSNLVTTDRVHGLDDYTIIDPIIADIEIRVAQIDSVLDKHARPTMYGPESAVEAEVDDRGEPTGYYTFKAGKFVITQTRSMSQSGEVGYLVWDAQMGASFEQIKLLLGQLRIMTELGALLADSVENMGQMPTGTALRTLMTNAIAKVARIRMTFDPVLKQAIRAAAILSGVTSPADISITWFDGLPDDPMETAQITQMRTGGKQTLSVRTAIMNADGKTEGAADDEIARIEEEAEAAVATNAMLTMATDTRPPDGEGLADGG